MAMLEGKPFIHVTEVFRDSIQAVPTNIPLGTKLEFIQRATDAIKSGSQATIEVGSFVSPKAMPQMADSATIIQQLHPKESVVYSVLIPNQRGFDDAMTADGGRRVVGEVAAFTAATDVFLKENLRTTPEASVMEIGKLRAMSERENIPFVAYVSCMADCPFDGPVSPETLRTRVDQLRQQGVRMIKLGATTGNEHPDAIARAIEVVQKNDEQYSGVALGGHTHHTRGNGVRNSLEFLKRGITSLDGSAAGVGVNRYAGYGIGVTDVDLPNNAPSDEIVDTLHHLGYDTAWDQLKLARAGLWLANQIKLPVHSRYAQSVPLEASTG